MGVKFNPFSSALDVVDSPNGDFDDIEVSGDITLDDGGTYTTTVQVVTPTANRTISFPDATGTVALVAGSSGQVTYNDAGSNAGLTSANIGSTGQINVSLAGAASTPPVSFTGSWFTGGTSTTTKPQLLIEPSGTTSTAWSTGGTGIGVNAASGFAGRLLDLQLNGTSNFSVNSAGSINTSGTLTCTSANGTATLRGESGGAALSGSYIARIDSSTNLGAHGLTRLTLGDGAYAVLGFKNTSNVDINGVFAFGGRTSSFPALNRSGTTLRVRLADNSAYTTIDAQHRLQGTAPASASATGTAGDIRYDADYIYVCTSTNTWKRAALATW